ncbi:MAG: hypothetical protein QNK78_03495 [Crocinitomicaceae bacterium]|jgi:hypothetical protein
MATVPIVNTFDRRAGVISAVIAMVLLLIVILFLTYEQADPLPEDIPIELAAPLNVTEVYDVVADLGGGGGTPSEAQQKNPKQIEQVLTSPTSDTQVSSGTGTNTSAPFDNGPSGDETPNMFGSGGDGGNGGGGSGPGFGPDGGPGSNGGPGGNGSGAGRSVKKHVDFDLDYDQVVKFAFKLTVDANGNVLKADVIMGQTSTTDQVLINKVKNAVIRQVKYSKSEGSAVVFKNYTFSIQPN